MSYLFINYIFFLIAFHPLHRYAHFTSSNRFNVTALDSCPTLLKFCTDIAEKFGTHGKSSPGHAIQRYKNHNISSFYFFSLTFGAVLWSHTKNTALMKWRSTFPQHFLLLNEMGHDIWRGGKLC